MTNAVTREPINRSPVRWLVWIACAVSILLVGLWWVAPDGGGPENVTDDEGLSASDEVDLLTAPGVRMVPQVERRTPASVPAAAVARSGEGVVPPSGPFDLVGQVLGSDGEPLRKKALRFEFGGKLDRAQPEVRTGTDGRFLYRRGLDEIALEVSVLALGHGVAPPVLAARTESGTLDLGVVQLEASGALRGTLVLHDGTPVAGAQILATQILATQVSHAQRPGLRSANDTTDDEGRFQMEGLALADFQIVVNGVGQLPVLGTQLFQSGPGEHRVTVDAVALAVACRGEKAAPRLMRSVEITSLAGWGPEYGQLQGGRSGTKCPFPDISRPTYTFYASRGADLALSAVDDDGKRFYGVVRHGLSAGSHDVWLEPTCPELGCLALQIQDLRVPDNAWLEVVSMQRDGTDSWPTFDEDGANERRARVSEIGGLRPGKYRIELMLHDGGEFVLATPYVEATLATGDRRSVEVRVVQD